MRLAAPNVSRTYLALGFGAMHVFGCHPKSHKNVAEKTVDAGAWAAADAQLFARAEASRRAADIPKDAFVGDTQRRTLALRAAARIADPLSYPVLRDGLHSEDEGAVSWAAYGLGFVCKTHEPETIRALSARASVRIGDARPLGDKSPDLITTSFRAIARCGGPLAEAALEPWLHDVRADVRQRASLALGDLAQRQRSLRDETTVSLLDAARGGEGQPPIPEALYPISRIKLDGRFADKVLASAAPALATNSDARIFAIRALCNGGAAAALVLRDVVRDATATPAERAEAARSLGQLGDAGVRAAEAELTQLYPSKDPLAIAAFALQRATLVESLLAALGDEPRKEVESLLYSFAGLRAPDTNHAIRLRLARVRCKAAGLLARGSVDSEVLLKCDDAGSEPYEFARLSALARKPLLGARKDAWYTLTQSTHVRVREAAIELVGTHLELADAGRAELVKALADHGSGVVATAAEVLFSHPQSAFTVAASERKAALDPNAPPPKAEPEKELDTHVHDALIAAILRVYPDDAVETRASLLAAAVALHLPEAPALAKRLCTDSNGTLRARAEVALRNLGDKDRKCAVGVASAVPNTSNLALARENVTLTFITSSGELRIRLESELAPMTVARIAALATSGFYKGIVVHRVVPSFVVQFGDPQGDGYGGSGSLLPCETAPVPFTPFSVGMALAGRDTGSSQMFVTLAATPHLDGEYTRIGSASGDWSALVEGDVITDVRVSN